MSLPGITAPVGTPLFLADGHSITEDSMFAAVRSRTGHARLRRVRTAGERIVSVAWLLEADELLSVIDWFEDTLQSGALEFAALVANQGPGQRWWRARWVSFETEMLHKGRGRVTGTLFLIGDPSETGPDLSQLAAEAVVALQSSATATIPALLAAEVVIALQAQSGDTLLAAEVDVGLDGAAVFGFPLAAEAVIALDGSATATIGTGGCADFAVLGDLGITVSSGGAISPLADTGETFDSCRTLT